VLNAIAAAPILPSGLVETPTLRALRRYLSAALSFDPSLKVGDTEYDSLKGRPDELPFLQLARRLAIDTIFAVWRDPHATLADRRARSDWIWSALRVEQWVRSVPNDGNVAFASLLIATLLFHTAEVGGRNWQQTIDRRRAFFAWLNDAALQPRAWPGNADFLDLVTGHLKEMLTSLMSTLIEKRDPEARTIAGHFVRRHVSLLPDIIRQQLIDDEAFTAAIGLPTARGVRVGSGQFEFNRFWKAAEQALLYGKSRLRTEDGRLVRMKRDQDAVVLSGRIRARAGHDANKILGKRGAARVVAIKEHLRALDLAPADTAMIEAKAIATPHAGELVAILDQAREASVVMRYQSLATAIRQHRPYDPSLLMPPPVAHLRHHLRLPIGPKSISERCTEAWGELKERIGARNAFRRLAGMPIDLSAAILKDLTVAQRDQAVTEILGAVTTPLSAIHAARLCRELSLENELEQLLKRMVDGTRKHGALFSSLMHWSEKAFQTDPDWHSAEVGDRLALVWAHAQRLFDIFLSCHVDSAATASLLRELPPQQSLAANFIRDPAYEKDCANPGLVAPNALLFHGLGYIFDSTDLMQQLGTDELLPLVAIFTALDRDQIKPSANLSMRAGALSNRMESVLDCEPTGIFDESTQPELMRQSELEQAFAALEIDPHAADAWIRVSAFGRPVLELGLCERLQAIFKAVSLATLADATGRVDVCRIVLDARLRLGGPISDDELFEKLFQLAKSRAELYPGVANAEPGSAAASCFTDTLEILADASRGFSPQAPLDLFARCTAVLVNGWPSSAQSLRAVFDTLVRRESPAQSGALWGAFVRLRSWQ
jgi:hypothetical protein